MTPKQFEDAIAELFRSLGYEVRQTPYTNDGGKDAIAWKDGRTYLIECKRYEQSRQIGRRDVQIFLAAMHDEKADAGFYVNTGIFTKSAIEYAAKNRITVYDRLTIPLLVNEAYPSAVDASGASTVCLECGSLTVLPVGESQFVGQCTKGHSITNTITLTDLRVINSAEAPTCDKCGTPMRIVKGRRGPFWGCSQFPRCRWTKRMHRQDGTP
jgi:hypothetical protein